MPSSLTIRIKLDGDDVVLQDLRKLGADGEAALKKLKEASDALGSRGGFLAGVSAAVSRARGSFTELGTGFKALGDAGRDFGDKIATSAKRIGILTAAIAGAGAGLVALAKGSADSAPDIRDTAESFGLTTDQVQKFTDAAKLSGGGLDDVIGLLERFQGGLAKAGSAAGEAANPLGELAANVRTVGGVASQFGTDAVKVVRGLDSIGAAAAATGASLLDNLTGRTAAEQLLEFANRIIAIPTQLGRIQALLAAGFKPQGLAKTLDILRGLVDAQKHILPVIDETTLKLGDELSIAINATSINLTRLKDQLIDTFLAPALTKGLNAFGDLLIANQGKILRFAESLRNQVQPIIQGVLAALGGAQIGAAAVPARPDQLGATPDTQAATAALTEQEQQAVQVRDAVLQIKEAFVAIGGAARGVFAGVVMPLFELARSVAGGLAGIINSLFGTSLTANTVLLAAALFQITGALGLFVSTIQLAAAGLTLLTTALPLAKVGFGLLMAAVDEVAIVITALVATFGGIPVAIGAALVVAAGLFVAFWPSIKSGASDAADAIAGFFTRAIGWIEDQFNGLVEFVERIWTKISNIVSSIISAVQNALNAQANAQPQSAGPAGFAGGGFVRGPGTATSDSIPARLSRGEFVQRAAAVRHYGVDLMAAINALRVPRDQLRSALRGFSLGGLVDSLGAGIAVPHFAAGGLVLGGAGAGGRPLLLQIGGETIGGMTASDSAVARLQRHTARRAAHRIGNGPSWRGGR